MTHVVYVLHSQVLNRFYIGYSADLELRLEFHQNADLRKFTYRADDWTLFFTLECASCQMEFLCNIRTEIHSIFAFTKK